MRRVFANRPDAGRTGEINGLHGSISKDVTEAVPGDIWLADALTLIVPALSGWLRRIRIALP